MRDDLADDRTDAAADECLGRKGVDEDRLECGEDARVVDRDDRKGAEHEENDHEGNDLLGNARDPLQTSEGDQCGQDHDQRTEDQVVERDARQNLNRGEGADVEGLCDIGNDLVDLSHASDTEGGEHGEDAEEDGKHASDVLHALLSSNAVNEVVHGTARPLAVLVLSAEVDAKDVLGIVGHHAEECGNPHPEHGTGTADADRGGNACDITRTDRCGKRRAKRLERGDRALFLTVRDDVLLEKASERVLKPHRNMRHLEEFRQGGCQNARTDEQDQAEHAPNDTVDLAVNGFDRMHDFFHFINLQWIVFRQPNKKYRSSMRIAAKKKRRRNDQGDRYEMNLSFCLRDYGDGSICPFGTRLKRASPDCYPPTVPSK